MNFPNHHTLNYDEVFLCRLAVLGHEALSYLLCRRKLQDHHGCRKDSPPWKTTKVWEIDWPEWQDIHIEHTVEFIYQSDPKDSDPIIISQKFTHANGNMLAWLYYPCGEEGLTTVDLWSPEKRKITKTAGIHWNIAFTISDVIIFRTREWLAGYYENQNPWRPNDTNYGRELFVHEAERECTKNLI